MLASGAFGRGRERAVGAGAGAVGEERVVGGPRREQTFGRAEDVHAVDVVADAFRHRPDVHAGADRPDPVEHGVELQLEKFHDPSSGRGGGAGRGGAQRGVDAAGCGGVLGWEVVGEEGEEGPDGGRGVGPGGGGVEGVERGLEVLDEGSEVVGGGGVAVVAVGEPLAGGFPPSLVGGLRACVVRERLEARPRVAAGDAGGARHAFPGAARSVPALVVDGAAGDEAEDLGASEVVFGQGEQAQDGAAVRGLDGGPDAAAEEGDVGATEVLVQQPRVGVGARVQDGDAMALVDREVVDDAADDGADLVVGVGGVQDPRGGGDGLVVGVEVVSEGSRDGERAGIGVVVAGEAEQDVEVGRAAQCPEECELGWVEVLGQEEDEPSAVVLLVGGVAEEVRLVVGRRLKVGDERAVQGDGAGDDLVVAEGVDRRVRVRLECAVCLGDGAHGADVLGNRSEGPGVLAESAPDRVGETRSREGSAPLGKERAGRARLRDAAQGQGRDGGDTRRVLVIAAREGSSGGDADAL